MKEFYLEAEGRAVVGPLELSEALDLIPFYVPMVAKRRAIEQYTKGEAYAFNFSYGFNAAKVSVEFLSF